MNKYSHYFYDLKSLMYRYTIGVLQGCYVYLALFSLMAYGKLIEDVKWSWLEVSVPLLIPIFWGAIMVSVGLIVILCLILRDKYRSSN